TDGFEVNKEFRQRRMTPDVSGCQNSSRQDNRRWASVGFQHGIARSNVAVRDLQGRPADCGVLPALQADRVCFSAAFRIHPGEESQLANLESDSPLRLTPRLVLEVTGVRIKLRNEWLRDHIPGPPT